jgi:hypothetical protein
MYSSFTERKIIPKAINRNKEKMTKIKTTLPYMDERNFTYRCRIGNPVPFSLDADLNPFMTFFF